MGRVDTDDLLGSVRKFALRQGAGQSTEVTLKKQVHGIRTECPVGKLLTSRVQPRSKKGTARDFRLLDILGDGFGGCEVQANFPSAISLLVHFIVR